MIKRIAVLLLCAVFLCTASAYLLHAEGGAAPFSTTSHDPPAHEVGVPLSSNIQATFDDDVNPTTVSNDTFVVHGHLGGLASGTFTYHTDTSTVTLYPGRAFHAGEVLRVSATRDIRSIIFPFTRLTPYGWQFTAGPVVDRYSAGFTDIGAGLTGVWFSSVAWGDYDNDSDLDILVTGYPGVSKVYRNDGGGSFGDIGAGLTAVRYSSVAWGDYDKDGDLDVVLTGEDSGGNYVSRVYRNDGGGVFINIDAGLTGVAYSSVAWGDYDNDGDLDILLTGSSSGGGVSRVYRNDGSGVLTDIASPLTGVAYSSVAWGDYDNDGDLDILLTGQDSGATSVSKVYRNDGGGVFADINAALAPVQNSSVAWGDYDNDSDLDILLTGGLVSRVYRNDGGGAFIDIGAGLTGVHESSAAWGDVDNDGDLDILLTGVAGGINLVSKVYRNDGGGVFTDIGAALTGVWASSVAWGDCDNDGDLDILLAGSSSGGGVCKVYRNNSRPALGSVVPSSGSCPIWATTYFTTTWSDPDGWENLKQCYFHIGASPSLAGNVTLLYNAAKDKLWLLDDSGTSWLGGCTPGQATFVWNSQAELDCSQTAVQGVGDTLEVRWAIQFLHGFEGSRKLGLKCKDRDKAKAKGKWKGTWTIE
jgi:predicted nucleotidyltransferase